MVHFSHEERVKNRELASNQRNIESVILYVFWSKLIRDFVNVTIDETYILYNRDYNIMSRVFFKKMVIGDGVR